MIVLLIIEGVYSYHYKLRDFYTHLVYLNVSKETQNERLKNRCGENKLLYNKFINTWIPNEENYFNNNDIISKADIII